MPGFSLRPVLSHQDAEHNFKVIWWLLTGRADDVNVASAGAAGVVNWSNILDKPSVFVPTEHGNEKHEPPFAPSPHGSGAHSEDYLLKNVGDSLPIAKESLRGDVFTLTKGSGEEDEVYVCIKLEDDTYDWKQVSLLQGGEING